VLPQTSPRCNDGCRHGNIELDAYLMLKTMILDLANDIQSLSHFKRNSNLVMTKLKESGGPVVLTVNGKAEIVVQDAAAYQRLVALAEKAEMMEFLQESREDAITGDTLPARKFLESLGKKKRSRKR
jgi:prevent-host-death family protein